MYVYIYIYIYLHIIDNIIMINTSIMTVLDRRLFGLPCFFKLRGLATRAVMISSGSKRLRGTMYVCIYIYVYIYIERERG